MAETLDVEWRQQMAESFRPATIDNVKPFEIEGDVRLSPEILAFLETIGEVRSVASSILSHSNPLDCSH